MVFGHKTAIVRNSNAPNNISVKILRLQQWQDGLSLAGRKRKGWPGMPRVGDMQRKNAKINFRFLKFQ